MCEERFFSRCFAEKQTRRAAEESHGGGGEEGAEDLDEEEAARETGRVQQTEDGEEREGALSLRSSYSTGQARPFLFMFLVFTDFYLFYFFLRVCFYSVLFVCV